MSLRERLYRDESRFSTWIIGVSGFSLNLLGLLLYMIFGEHCAPKMMPWFFVSLILLALALAMHFATDRALFVKLYTVVVMTFVCVIYSTLFPVSIGRCPNMGTGIVIVIIWVLVMIVVGVVVFWKTLSNPVRKVMPHDDIGVLDTQSGLIDLTNTPGFLEHEKDKRKLWNRFAIASLPLIAALSLLLVGILPVGGDRILLTIMAIFFSFIGAFAVGRNLALVAAIYRWEKWHGKLIRIKR